jgi:hypothetical protein
MVSPCLRCTPCAKCCLLGPCRQTAEGAPSARRGAVKPSAAAGTREHCNGTMRGLCAAGTSSFPPKKRRGKGAVASRSEKRASSPASKVRRGRWLKGDGTRAEMEGEAGAAPRPRRALLPTVDRNPGAARARAQPSALITSTGAASRDGCWGGGGRCRVCGAAARAQRAPRRSCHLASSHCISSHLISSRVRLLNMCRLSQEGPSHHLFLGAGVATTSLASLTSPLFRLSSVRLVNTPPATAAPASSSAGTSHPRLRGPWALVGGVQCWAIGCAGGARRGRGGPEPLAFARLVRRCSSLGPRRLLRAEPCFPASGSAPAHVALPAHSPLGLGAAGRAAVCEAVLWSGGPAGTRVAEVVATTINRCVSMRGGGPPYRRIRRL